MAGANDPPVDAQTPSNNNNEQNTPVTGLIPPFGETSPVQSLRTTLDYAVSPHEHLLRILGADLLAQRSHLLSLLADGDSNAIDRDLYGTGKHKQHFEQHIARLLGKSHGLFFVTGVQAQLTACKLHCDAFSGSSSNNHNDRVAWHYRSHLEIAEEKAYEEVFRLKRSFLGKSQMEVPTIRDMEAVTSLPECERPAVVVLELPNRELGCRTYPWEDLVQMSKLCKAANVKMHMDGARIWEIEPYYQHRYNKSFADLAALFDSVYVSFYKGLGGVCGAMLCSSDESFMQTAKTWQRRMGGNTVTSYQEIIDCERGYNSNIGTFHDKWQKMRSVVVGITAATEGHRTKDGKAIVYFNPPEATCAQIHTHIQGVTAEQIEAARDAVEAEHYIRVFNKLRPWKNLDEVQNAKLVQRGDDKPSADEGAVPENETPEEMGAEGEHHYLEWVIGSANMGIADDVFVKGWKELCQILSGH